MALMNQQVDGLTQYIHIEKNDFLYRKHKTQKEEDINTCDCKYNNDDPESACGESCLNVLTSTECTPGYCLCGIYCKNQRFQKCEYAKLKLVQTESRGWGLLADEDIKAGQFIIEYCGEVISWQEAKQRSHAYENEGLKDAFIISLSGQESIDATKKGSLARFINHSCQPNCETRKWTVLGEVRVGIFAKQDIPVGSELTYNYNFEWYGGAKVRCLCGAAGCSEFLGAKSRGFQEAAYLWDDNDARSCSSMASDMKGVMIIGSGDERMFNYESSSIMPSPLKVKRPTMTDKMRRALCEYKKEHASSSQEDLQKWVEQEFNVSVNRSTISRTLKRSVEYLSDEMKCSNVKRHKPAKYPDIEKALYEWFLRCEECEERVSGEMIRNKGKELLLKKYGETHPEFQFSNGWLESFKSRHGIKSYGRFSERGLGVVESIDNGSSGLIINLDKLQWKDDSIDNVSPGLRAKLDQFKWKDVYNMDETGLFYRLEADHSLATKQLEGHKKDMERITIVVCCNGDGSDKVPLWVIGKYAEPNCFKNVNMRNLNCQYRANKRAWMTSLLFQEFVHWFDKRMKGRKVLLLVDTCPAHSKVTEGLKNVELFFIPSSGTSRIKPFNGGIIRALKINYRRRFYSSILEGYEIGAKNLKKFSLLNAINFLSVAWRLDVKTSTISNCFQHCKIQLSEDMAFEPQVNEDEGIHGLYEAISGLCYSNMMDVEHLLNYPCENDAVKDFCTGKEIITWEPKIPADDEDEDPDDSSVLPIVSAKDAFEAVITLKNHLLQHERDIPEAVNALQEIKDKVEVIGTKKRQRQTT